MTCNHELLFAVFLLGQQAIESTPAQGDTLGLSPDALTPLTPLTSLRLPPRSCTLWFSGGTRGLSPGRRVAVRCRCLSPGRRVAVRCCLRWPHLGRCAHRVCRCLRWPHLGRCAHRACRCLRWPHCVQQLTRCVCSKCHNISQIIAHSGSVSLDLTASRRSLSLSLRLSLATRQKEITSSRSAWRR